MNRGFRSAAVVIAVTLQRLVEDATRFWTPEERLVLDALRRSSNALNDATIPELAAYVGALSPEQLRGVVSNVKGIYHELLFVHAENIDGDEITARVFEATNHPGADVEFLVDGEVIRSVQLKAVASASAIHEHLTRYPGIEVLATEEVATKVGIAGSGFRNGDLKTAIDEGFAELPSDGLVEDVAEAAGTSLLVAAALTAGKVLREGRVNRAQMSAIFGDVAVGAVAATALDALLETLA